MEKLRKIRDEKEARQCVAAARAAGNLGQWARAHGYDGRSLHAWAMNLGRRAPAAKVRRARPARNAREGAPALVELVPSPSPMALGQVVVVLGDVRIEVGPDFDAATLQRLLAVLRAC
ncbi:hypothetical protein [Thauera aminoaromatica]|uniref:hypothetical protein n=1 Tax=Thauera aminoaromatica TaxID=164330 RepID=UPI0035B2F101